MELVVVLWLLLVRVAYGVHYVLEPVLGHVRVETKRGAIPWRDGLVGPPQISVANSGVTRNEKQTPEESKELSHVDWICDVLVCLREDNVANVIDREGEEEELELIHLGDLIPPEIDPPPLHLLVALPYPWAGCGLHPLPDRWWAWIIHILFNGLVVVVNSVPLRP
jgi:hypothetical protein